MGLGDKIVAIHECFASVNVVHAFGGGLARAYYAEPRAMIDINVNVFLDPAGHARVVGALRALGVESDVPTEQVVHDGQCRVAWGSTPIDLFYAYHDLHQAMWQATRRAEFRGLSIPILAPEHLLTCKVIFNRRKDWLDIEQILVGALDTDHSEVADWLARIIGTDDPRAQRFAELSRAFERTP
jgi:hypothetical protein